MVSASPLNHRVMISFAAKPTFDQAGKLAIMDETLQFVNAAHPARHLYRNGVPQGGCARQVLEIRDRDIF